MKKFYRLENKEKTGIYYSHLMWAELSDIKDSNRHPSPGKDSKLVEVCKNESIFTYSEDLINQYYTFQNKDFIFGFETLEQYRAWFYDDNFLNIARKKGFSLNLYKTPDGFVGNTQMIARKGSLIFISECDILTGSLIS